MQRIHRQAHAWIWLFLAVFLPALLVLAILLREWSVSEPVVLRVAQPVDGSTK